MFFFVTLVIILIQYVKYLNIQDICLVISLSSLKQYIFNTIVKTKIYVNFTDWQFDK